ncbi:hypothetical protein M3P36_11885 [Altererythrobacter sp. KTW20L]|uniref:hypothetical protein n=1 Tax=Altererythrobacter sp. KTW20L TaxID=2942210 RepID=UPI0020C15809|nr:hypothetical protein [Altererythrobacter sp. KTW20L]MCL6251737.1 hypothetical protein [Altererythrobacter sp. KTW20L]
MSIRFAAPRHAIRNHMDDPAARAACLFPANDNSDSGPGDATLHAALRHFARHGLAAARHAGAQAVAARLAGDEQGFAWWLEICRALDRRMARELDRRAI